MTIKKIWGSRVSSGSGSTYVAESGMIFYDEADGELRLGDGVTPGGVPISVRADLITANSLLPATDNDDLFDLGSPTKRWHHLYVGDGGVKFNGDAYPDSQTIPYIPGAQVDNIIPAADNGVTLGDADKRFSSIYLGQDGLYLADQTLDTNINITVDDGTLYIDGAENLRLGNLAIRDTTLTSATPDLDISIGDTGDTGFFYINRKAQIDNTTFASTESMFSINASGATEPATLFPDTLMQATGRPNKNSRIVQRSYGSTGTVGGDNAYAVWASYAARGTITAPAALKEGDILSRLSSNGYGTTSFTAGGTRIESAALEDFTDTAKGSVINFWTTPVGQISPQNVASINSIGVVTQGIEFSGDETIQTTAGIPLTAKGNSAATQVATLGIDGKLDSSQIPDSLSGAVIFKGAWNATTNRTVIGNYELGPDNPPGVAAGWEYIVTVAGTVDIGDGSQLYAAGDFVIYDGSVWQHIVSSNSFSYLKGTTGGHVSVNGNYNTNEVGALVLTTDATPLSNASTIVSRDASGNFAANVITASLTGSVTGSVSGNAGSVTNGVYTNGSYANPTWITSLAGTKVTNAVLTTDTGTVTNTMLAGSIANAKLANSSITVNGTAIALGASGTVTAAAGTLTGTTLNATVVTSSLTSVGTLTNLAIAAGGTITTPRIVETGIRTVNDGTTLTIDFATDSVILWTAPGLNSAITLTNYTAGARVKVIIAITTSRDIAFGVAGVINSSTGATAWNGTGGGSIDVANTAMHLEYTCIDGTAANCYVAVTVN